MKKQVPVYERERSDGSDDNLVACTTCKGFFSRKYFNRHQKDCKDSTSGNSKPLPVNVLKACRDDKVSDEFKSEILAKFKCDQIGNFCKSNPTLISIGKKIFQGRINTRQDKVEEVRRGVMNEMRKLGSLYVLEKFEVGDMFLRKNFEILENAICLHSKRQSRYKTQTWVEI